jgi:hypothetical protein
MAIVFSSTIAKWMLEAPLACNAVCAAAEAFDIAAFKYGASFSGCAAVTVSDMAFAEAVCVVDDADCVVTEADGVVDDVACVVAEADGVVDDVASVVDDADCVVTEVD